MKKSVILLAALMPFIMFSCKDPDNGKREQGSTEIVGSSGKTLVKKMVAKGTIAYHDNDEEDGYYDYYRDKGSHKVDATLTFTYADGLMSRISGSGTFASVEDEEWALEGEAVKYHGESNANGNGNMSFTYKGDVVSVAMSAQGKISEKYTYEPDRYGDNDEWSNEGNFTGEYTLNMENGAAVSGRGTFRSDDGSSTTDKVKFEYDANNQLTKIYYEGDYEDRTEFKWENGNMVKMGWYYDYKSGRKHSAKRFFAPKKAKAAKVGVEWEDEYRVEYSSKENKSNLDFASLIFTYMSGFPEQAISVFGFAGKESKNLPSRIYEMDEEWNEQTGEYEEVERLLLAIDYDFNGDGTVKRLKLSSPVYSEEEGVDTATATINLEY